MSARPTGLAVDEALEAALRMLRNAHLRGPREISLERLDNLQRALDEHREREMKDQNKRAAIRAAAEELRGKR